MQLVPELEAGRNPPTLAKLTPVQAKATYAQKWLPQLKSIQDGTWAASLPPRPLASTGSSKQLGIAK